MPNCACGNRLRLGTEVSSGVCLNCQRGQEHLRDVVLPPSKVALRGSITSEEREVVSNGPDKGFSETKQQRWRRTHAEAWALINREGVARHRAKKKATVPDGLDIGTVAG